MSGTCCFGGIREDTHNNHSWSGDQITVKLDILPWKAGGTGGHSPLAILSPPLRNLPSLQHCYHLHPVLVHIWRNGHPSFLTVDKIMMRYVAIIGVSLAIYQSGTELLKMRDIGSLRSR